MKCEECFWFYERKLDNGRIWRECHKRPPEFVLKDTDECSSWPNVKRDDFCGEYLSVKMKTQQQIEDDELSEAHKKGKI